MKCIPSGRLGYWSGENATSYVQSRNVWSCPRKGKTLQSSSEPVFVWWVSHSPESYWMPCCPVLHLHQFPHSLSLPIRKWIAQLHAKYLHWPCFWFHVNTSSKNQPGTLRTPDGVFVSSSSGSWPEDETDGTCLLSAANTWSPNLT